MQQQILDKLLKDDKFDPEEIGSDFSSFLSLCSSQNIPLQKFLTIIVSYYQKGKIEDFLSILRFITTHEIDNSKYNNQQGMEGKIDILRCQASYYLQVAITSLDKQSQDENFREFNKVLNKIESIIPDYSKYSTLVGFNHFYRGELSLAQTHFTNAIMKKDDTIVPYMGQAQVEYHKQNYQESLNHLKSALKLCPNAPAGVRIAMAYCFYALKKFEMASLCFKRVLELDPNNIESIIGLANLEYKKENYDSYFENVQKAFQIDNTNILVLNALLQHYLMKGTQENQQKIQNIALMGIQQLKKTSSILKGFESNFRNDILEIKSRFVFALGYVEQIKQQIPQAVRFYQQSLSIYKNNFIAQYCLGQLQLQSQQYGESMKQMEQPLRNIQEGFQELIMEFNKPLAYLSSKQNNKQACVQYYNKALLYNPDDFESLIEYGQYLIEIDPLKSLTLFERAAAILLKKKQSDEKFIIQPEIYNNIGVLCHKQKQYLKSIQNFELGIESAKEFEQEDSFRYKSYLVTMYFNLGCSLQDNYQYIDAQNAFNKVLEINPYYLESHNRLAYIEFLNGNYKKALEICDFAIQQFVDLKSPRCLRIDAVICLKGYIEIQTHDERKGNETFRMMDKRFQFQDGYSNLSLIYSDYITLVQNRESYEGTKKGLAQFADFLSKSLKEIEPSNIHSAHILGVVMAEFGRPADCKSILLQIKEYAPQHPKIIFNLAQTEFLLRNYAISIQEFRKYQEKLTFFCEKTNLQIALCHILSKNYQQAQKTLKILILQNPSDIGLRYNYNVCLHLYSDIIIQNSQQYNVSKTQQAIQYLKNINKIYEYIAIDPQCRQSRLNSIQNPIYREKYKRKMDQLSEGSDERAIQIRALHDQFKHIEQQAYLLEKEKQLQAQEKKKKNQIYKEQYKLKMEQKRLEEERIKEEKAEKLRQIQEAQKKMMETFQDLSNQAPLQSIQSGKGNGSKRSKKNKDDEDNFIDDYVSQNDSDSDLIKNYLNDEDDDDKKDKKKKKKYSGDSDSDRDRKHKKKDKKKLKKLHKKQNNSDSELVNNDDQSDMSEEFQAFGEENHNNDDNNNKNEKEDQEQQQSESEEVVFGGDLTKKSSIMQDNTSNQIQEKQQSQSQQETNENGNGNTDKKQNNNNDDDDDDEEENVEEDSWNKKKVKQNDDGDDDDNNNNVNNVEGQDNNQDKDEKDDVYQSDQENQEQENLDIFDEE